MERWESGGMRHTMGLVALFLLSGTIGTIDGVQSFALTAGGIKAASCLPASYTRTLIRTQTGPRSYPSLDSFLKDKSSADASRDCVPDRASLRRNLDEGLAGNVTGASTILGELSSLRESGRQGDANDLVSALLSIIDDDSDKSTFMPLVRLRPLARFSRRARRASLRRVLRLSTPTMDDADDQEDPEAALGSRKRALTILLRTLATPEEGNDGGSAPSNSNFARRLKRKQFAQVPRIVSIERVARREAKAGATMEDMDSRLPPGLETPKYEVLARRGNGYEVRRYDGYSLCTVSMNAARPSDSTRTDAKISNPQLAGASSFGALAGYLFGKNDKSLSMKMTTPVVTTGQEDARQMSFVMPSEYWQEDSLNSAPKPFDASGVVLERDAGGDRAVLMFGGFAGKREVEKLKSDLLERLENDREWECQQGIPVALLQYNDPFTPPWKRRNEVSVPVVRKAASRFSSN